MGTSLNFYSKVQHEIDMMKDIHLSSEQKRFIQELNKKLYPVAYAGYIPHLKFPFYEFRCYSEFHSILKAVRFQTTDLFKESVKTLAQDIFKTDDISSIININEVGIEIKEYRNN